MTGKKSFFLDANKLVPDDEFADVADRISEFLLDRAKAAKEVADDNMSTENIKRFYDTSQDAYVFNCMMRRLGEFGLLALEAIGGPEAFDLALEQDIEHQFAITKPTKKEDLN